MNKTTIMIDYIIKKPEGQHVINRVHRPEYRHYSTCRYTITHNWTTRRAGTSKELTSIPSWFNPLHYNTNRNTCQTNLIFQYCKFCYTQWFTKYKRGHRSKLPYAKPTRYSLWWYLSLTVLSPKVYLSSAKSHFRIYTCNLDFNRDYAENAWNSNWRIIIPHMHCNDSNPPLGIGYPT